MPFNSAICPRNRPTRRQQAPKSAQCGPKPRNQAVGRIWGYVVQDQIPRAPSPPANPHFFVASKPQNRPRRRPEPRRFEPVVAHYGPWKIPKCLENGLVQDQKWVKKGLKTHFSNSDRGPYEKLKQLFFAHFEPGITRFGQWKIPKCLENGKFCDQKRYKMGEKCPFPKLILDPSGCPNK